MKALAIIIILFILIEKLYRPRIDVTTDGDWIMWYGKTKRKFIILYENTN